MMLFVKRFIKSTIALSAITLSACSFNNPYTLSADVNAFHQWPSQAQGKSYAFATEVTKSLEKQAQADIIAREMWRTGLVQTDNIKKAHYLVRFDTQVEQQEKIVREYYEEPFFYPSFGLLMGNAGYGWGNVVYTGMNIGYAPRVASYPVQFNRYTLAVEISTKAGKPVYQARAVASPNKASLMETMPYLARAVFDDFPGANGSNRRVLFDIDKSVEQNTPVKLETKD